jgi:hypothetical protein
MDFARIAKLGIPAAIVMLALGFFGHTILLAPYLETSGFNMRAEPDMPWVVAGYLVLGLLMAYLYPKLAGEGSPIEVGLKFGVLIALLWTLPLTLVLQGALEQDSTTHLIDLVWHLLEQGVGGVVMAYLAGMWS